MSRDSHIGNRSRRADLEILGYNIVHWLCGQLPWSEKSEDLDYMDSQKRAYMDDISKFMSTCFPDGTPPGVEEYMSYVASLAYDEDPDYERLRNILRDGLTCRGYKDDGKVEFLSATPKAASKRSQKGTGKGKE